MPKAELEPPVTHVLDAIGRSIAHQTKIADALKITLNVLELDIKQASREIEKAEYTPIEGIHYLAPITCRSEPITYWRKEMNRIVGVGQWVEIDYDGPVFLVPADRWPLALLISYVEWDKGVATYSMVRKCYDTAPKPYPWDEQVLAKVA